MTDFLDDKRREITKRLEELKPLVEEHHLLEAAAAALRKIPAASKEASVTAARPTRRRRKRGHPRGSVNRASEASQATAPASAPVVSSPAEPERKKPGRPKGSGKKVGRPPGKVGRPKGRGGRRKGSGTRSKQALRLVREQPGITVAELATKMGIKATYLYKVLPPLEQEGKIRKEGRGWFPARG